MTIVPDKDALLTLKNTIKEQALALGFQQCGVAHPQIDSHVSHYKQWLTKDYFGDMEYMKTREPLRSDPQALVPDTLSVITVRLDYLPKPAQFSECLSDSKRATISRYALGRDYHKLMRKKLAKLAQFIESSYQSISDQPVGHRVFVDSAPVLERAYGEESGLGWIGKNTMLIHPDAGSFFFLGEILTTIPLEPDSKMDRQCGECQSCIQLCPTQAIVAPNVLDATRCISYLTIEHHGSIDESLRPLMGNRIYGCDDCQLVCPINRFANATQESDFHPRNDFDDVELLTLFEWSEKEFLSKTEGSPIRRIGHEKWLRNIAIALGNAEADKTILQALQRKKTAMHSELVIEHIDWAIEQQQKKLSGEIPIQFVETKQHQKLIRTTKKIMGHID